MYGVRAALRILKVKKPSVVRCDYMCQITLAGLYALLFGFFSPILSSSPLHARRFLEASMWLAVEKICGKYSVMTRAMTKKEKLLLILIKI